MIARRSALMLLAATLVAAPGLAATKPAAAKPAAAKAAPARPDWANTVAATPAGGILIGNPAARVKLIEFASYTCSHCKAFHEEGLPALKANYIATGNVSFEQRSFVRNGADFAASLLVACLPAKQGLAFAGKLFAEQAAWVQPFAEMSEADNQAVAALPPEQQPGELARIGKLDVWAAARGIPAARSKVCLASKTAQDQLIATRAEAMQVYKLEGTPTFGINGVPVAGVYDWGSLEPKLQAALKSPKP